MVGLGNPGAEYAQSRHNAGFRLVEIWAETLASQVQITQPPVWQTMKKIQAEVCKLDDWVFLKPQTFMNASGSAIRAALDYFSQFNHQSLAAQQKILSQVMVIHDDLDLEFGTAKLQFGKGPKIHNGLLSIYQHLGTQDFWHVRIGIDGRGGKRQVPAKTYVLQSWTVEEQLAWQKLPPQWLESWSARLK